jgi:hypothetical protein
MAYQSHHCSATLLCFACIPLRFMFLCFLFSVAFLCSTLFPLVQPHLCLASLMPLCSVQPMHVICCATHLYLKLSWQSPSTHMPRYQRSTHSSLFCISFSCQVLYQIILATLCIICGYTQSLHHEWSLC